MSQSLNPWISIWIEPRATMRQILDTDPKRLVILLIALSTIASTLDYALGSPMALEHGLPAVFIGAVVVGALAGIVSLYVFGYLIKWTGSWIGGKGDVVAIRASMAWAGVPTIYLLGFYMVLMLVYGSSIHQIDPETMMATPGILPALFAKVGLQVVIGIWTMFISFKTLGEAQGFSAWKAVLNYFLSTLVIIVPAIVIMLVVYGQLG
jgi:hypothetical protein